MLIIKLVHDLPVEKVHGMTEGKILQVRAIWREGTRGRGYKVLGDKGITVCVHRQECQIVSGSETEVGSNDFFHVGEQVAYVPDHANGKLEHRDTEYGFAFSMYEEDTADKDTLMVRYWSRGTDRNNPVLRTVANGESTPKENLVRYDFTNRAKVLETIETIRRDAGYEPAPW